MQHHDDGTRVTYRQLTRPAEVEWPRIAARTYPRQLTDTPSLTATWHVIHV